MMLIVTLQLVIMVLKHLYVTLLSSKQFLLDPKVFETVILLKDVSFVFMLELLNAHVIAWLVFFVFQAFISI